MDEAEKRAEPVHGHLGSLYVVNKAARQRTKFAFPVFTMDER